MNIFKMLQSKGNKEKCKHPALNVEADFSADPLWCSVCGYNLDIDDFPLTEELKEELFNWIQNFKEVPMAEHNKIGMQLTIWIKEEIGKDYPITFIEQ